MQTSLNRVFSRYGMTLQEASVLLRCIEAGKIAPVRLAVIVGRDRAKITRFVKRLEAAGLLRRTLNPRDPRHLIIQPTTDGRRVGREVALAFRNIRKELFSGISEADIERLGQMLPQLHKNAAGLGAGRLATGKAIRRRIGSRRLKQQAKAHAARAEANRAFSLVGAGAFKVPLPDDKAQSIAENLPKDKTADIEAGREADDKFRNAPNSA